MLSHVCLQHRIPLLLLGSSHCCSEGSDVAAAACCTEFEIIQVAQAGLLLRQQVPAAPVTTPFNNGSRLLYGMLQAVKLGDVSIVQKLLQLVPSKIDAGIAKVCLSQIELDWAEVLHQSKQGACASCNSC